MDSRLAQRPSLIGTQIVGIAAAVPSIMVSWWWLSVAAVAAALLMVVVAIPATATTGRSCSSGPKDARSAHLFGAERYTAAVGRERFVHSIAANDGATERLTVFVGRPQCTQPYDMAWLHASG